MARRRTDEEVPESRRRPATTPDELENEMVSLAYNATRKRIERGEASSQELVHFLKLGSSRERLEQERLSHENQLTQAKIADIQSRARIEELYGDAIKAFGMYRGELMPGDDDDEG